VAKVRTQNPAQTAAALKQARFTSMSRLSSALQKEFKLQSLFKLGYRNKEDISNLPPYVLVVGSQNVLTNAAEQVGIRNGTTLDGPAGNQNDYGIDSAYDFNNRVTGIQNLRKWGPNLEVRHENPTTGVVSWVNLLSTLTATAVANFTDFWSTAELKNLMLMVNGAGQPVYEWSGAVASYESSTSNTITVQGTASLSAGLNFYNNPSNAGKFQLLINGQTYLYTSAGNASATPYSQTPTNNNIPINNSNWSAQIFTTGAGAVSITSAVVAWNATGAQAFPAVFFADIYTDNAGVPGTLLGSAQWSTAGIGGAGDSFASFTFDSLFVSPATNYHLVVHAQQGDSNVNVKTGASGVTGTTVSSDSGATWSVQNGYLYATITENDTNTTTFIGVTPDPTAAGISVGDAIMQKPIIGVVTPTGVPTTFVTDLISTLGNQVYYGSESDHTVYISAVNNYGTCAFSTPRLPGEGASAVLDAAPVGISPQDDSMLISAGMDFWYQSTFTLSADLVNESFAFNRLKTTANQGAQSQALISKMKNNTIFVSYEPIFNSLGTTKDFLNSPQTTNLSDPIRNDMDAYDFTGGSSYYYNYYLYFTVPTMGVVRLYNLQKKYWEAPQIMSVGRFYQVDGQLYGHSYLTNESYQVFVPDVYNDNGNPIQAIAAFPYVSSEGAQPNQQKFFNRFYTEGYIAGNTKLTVTVNYDFGAFSGTYSALIDGSDTRIIFNRITDGSLGQNSLGTQPIGTILNLPNNNPVPKFRIINTFSPINNYEYQVVYSSYDIDTQWALLRFGPDIKPSTDMPVSISQ
jgi:hypothetical protein